MPKPIILQMILTTLQTLRNRALKKITFKGRRDSDLFQVN